MNNEIVPFAFQDMLVRTVMDEIGETWFVAKDVCAVLDIKNHNDAISDLDEDEKAGVAITDPSSNGTVQSRKMTTISESGLYSLVFRSRKKEAQVFRKWVTSEVLPSIRNTGSYIVKQPSIAKPPAKSNFKNLSMPDIALSLRQNMRQRLWQDAIQTVRLDNGTSEDVLHWFGYLCELMGARREIISIEQHIRDFYLQCVEEVEGHKIKVHTLYEHFRLWLTGKGEMPSIKVFSKEMQNYARHLRSNGSYFSNIRVKGV